MTADETGATRSLISITEKGRDVVLEYRARSDKPNADRLAMWVETTGTSDAEFTYDMYLKSVDEAGPSDVVVQVHDDLSVVVPEASVEQLRGATIDLADGPSGGGLYVINPNSPSPAVGAAAPPQTDLSGDVAQRVMQVLNQQVNPAIAAHGGGAELVAIEDDTAFLRLSGGCVGCGMATVTLTQGIEVSIKELVPEIARVVDVTDHASGTNPYYEPAKK